MKALSVQALLNELTAHGQLVGVFGELPQTAANLRTDSRAVQPGDLFCCIVGYTTDGHDHAPAAAANGAALFLCERPLPLRVPYIQVRSARRATALAARLYYDDPTGRCKLIGVTGTNGKTTIIHIIDRILSEAGYVSGRIGTLGYAYGGRSFPLDRTTPDILDLNRILAEMVDGGAQYIVMEVSSHSLALDRVFGLRFALGVFVNLGRDHLDFHRDLEDYKRAKFLLFDYLKHSNGAAVINVDDDAGRELYDSLNIRKSGVSFHCGDYRIDRAVSRLQGATFTLRASDREEAYRTRLIGRFNILNAALAVAAVHELLPQLPEPVFQRALAGFSSVSGRLEPVANERELGLYVDYAHTPDALENVLGALADIPHGRIICVMGAGGDRDRGKRPLMTATALRFADVVILTSDNPRSEDPRDILREMAADVEPLAPWWVITDRREAILAALRLAQPQDIVLVAGKGHETYQETNGRREHFDDREELRAAPAHTAQLIPEADDSSCIPLALPIDPLMLELLYGLAPAPRAHALYTYVALDSRSITPGSLFFALVGERFDGNDYAAAILADPANGAVVSLATDAPHALRVNDTLSALGLLACKYAGLFAAHRVALTGSMGKTTTKEYLYQILSAVAPTLRTPENENNQVGLPKTLLRLRPQHRWAICELGTNHPGEIAALARICRPHTGVVTAIGASHLEYFGSVDGVLREKRDLLLNTSGARLFPGDEPLFADFEGVSFGACPDCDYRFGEPQPADGGLRFAVNDHTYAIASPVPHNARNAAIAAAVALELGVGESTVRTALALPLQVRHRMEVQQSGGRVLILDCYNATPDSMRAAISFWLGLHPQRPHAAILGDMLELGEAGESYHTQIGALLPQGAVVYAVGPLAAHYGAARHYNDVRELLASDAPAALPADAVILVKGSHGIHLEQTIDRLRLSEREG